MRKSNLNFYVRFIDPDTMCSVDWTKVRVSPHPINNIMTAFCANTGKQLIIDVWHREKE